MKISRWFCLLFLITVAAVSFAGDVQVVCPPDIRVYLDGQFMGTSNTMQDGFFLIDVRKGTHVIRLEKDGFVPQNIEVEVSDFPIEVRVGALVPDPAARYKTQAKEEPIKERFGHLIVTSAPQNCTVEIDGRTEIKETPQLSIDGLKTGEHTISFSKPGYETISGVVNILAGTEVTVRGNLLEGRVETIHQGQGSLRVFSKPKRCTIRFRGTYAEKTDPTWKLTHIPAGEYPIRISISGREISTKVLIMDGMRTVLDVSFVKGDEPFTVSYVPH